jgi:hypothetical protein
LVCSARFLCLVDLTISVVKILVGLELPVDAWGNTFDRCAENGTADAATGETS